jgi:hypothetical protein
LEKQIKEKQFMKTEMVYSKRGVMNKINIGIYIIFNFLMTCWLFSFLGDSAQAVSECSGQYADACATGTGLGSMLGISFILGVWFVFGMVGGLIIYVTRPKNYRYKVVDKLK